MDARETILVFEKSPRWAPELERQFVDTDVAVRSYRATADLRRFLGTSSEPGTTQMVLLDFDSSPADCLQLLGQPSAPGTSPPVLAIASPRTAELEWSLRELGARHVIVDSVCGDTVARLCRRLLSSG